MKINIKLIFCILFVASLIFYGGISYHDFRMYSSNLHIRNVEALTDGEEKNYYTCEGNINICAEGFDTSTGHNFVIHGILVYQGAH